MFMHPCLALFLTLTISFLSLTLSTLPILAPDNPISISVPAVSAQSTRRKRVMHRIYAAGGGGAV